MKKIVRKLMTILCICLAMTACCDCSQYPDEHYSEPDTLSLISPSLRNLKALYSDIGELPADAPADRAYRMHYRHAFEECAYSIRLEHKADACSLTCTMTQEVELEDKWQTNIISNTQKLLPSDRWEEFEELMGKADFWTSPQVSNRRGFDGYVVILEGYRREADACGRRAYHLIQRWSPEDGPLKDAVALLLEYAEVINPENEDILLDAGASSHM